MDNGFKYAPGPELGFGPRIWGLGLRAWGLGVWAPDVGGLGELAGFRWELVRFAVRFLRGPSGCMAMWWMLPTCPNTACYTLQTRIRDLCEGVHIETLNPKP